MASLVRPADRCEEASLARAVSVSGCSLRSQRRLGRQSRCDDTWSLAAHDTERFWMADGSLRLTDPCGVPGTGLTSASGPSARKPLEPTKAVGWNLGAAGNGPYVKLVYCHYGQGGL